MNKLVISLTHGRDDPHQASLGFVVANSGVVSGLDTVVFLSTEGAYLSQRGAADGIHEARFLPLAGLIASFVAAGGAIWVCGSCFRKRNLSEQMLLANTRVVGGAALVELLSNGASCISY